MEFNNKKSKFIQNIMAGSLNKVQLIGRLGADPEIKQMVNGKSVARLSIATVSYTHLTLPTISDV